MRILLGALVGVLAVPLVSSPAVAGHSHHQHGLDFHETVVDAGQSFRGLDAVDRRTAWVTGASTTEGDPGRIFRTTDGGRSWDDVSPPGTEGLNFRDVEARSDAAALVLAIGEGEASRIYRTTDGGQTWDETFRNTDAAAFYNCMDFYPGGRHGLAVSDSVDGKFRIIGTDDGGRSWDVLPSAGMPDSTGEANFSASGDCLVIRGKDAWFGGGGAAARIFHSTDRGLTWEATDSTIPTGDAAGVFSLAFKDPRHGLAVGGNFSEPLDGVDSSAYTRDGRTWHNGGDMSQLGEDAAWLSGRGHVVLVTGESGETAGTDVSFDAGRTWHPLTDLGYHTLDCTKDRSCWAAGSGGRVARLRY
jgi:photosystem II stability/assembly factor-like uncharacterized protein